MKAVTSCTNTLDEPSFQAHTTVTPASWYRPAAFVIGCRVVSVGVITVSTGTRTRTLQVEVSPPV